MITPAPTPDPRIGLSHPGGTPDPTVAQQARRQAIADAWRAMRHETTADGCRRAVERLGNAWDQPAMAWSQADNDAVRADLEAAVVAAVRIGNGGGG